MSIQNRSTCVLQLLFLVLAVNLAIRAPAVEAQAGPGVRPKAQTQAPETASPGSEATVESGVADYAPWLITFLGAGVVVVLVWALRGRRRPTRHRDGAFAELGTGESATGERFSSTKIQVAEVNDRLGSKVETTEIETEREYALVVDEEALKPPPIPSETDEKTGNAYADDAEIRQLVREKRAADAYAAYEQRLEEDGSVEFRKELEEDLGAQLLTSRRLDEAARVLEHLVETHADADLQAETFFNLGYVHFLRDSSKKSRRFFKRFIASETNPEHLRRARNILEKMEETSADS